MDIRSSLEGLKSILGANSPTPAVPQPRNGAAAGTSALSSDRATLSSAGSEVAQTAAGSDVRADKVSSVQAAIASGTYNIPASAVATKMVDAMLGGDR